MQVITITPDGAMSGKRGFTGKFKTKIPVEQRLKKRLAETDERCLVFTGYRDQKGYGRIGDNDRVVRLAHRVAYELAYAIKLTSEQCVLHRCDNSSCCNPNHLFLGTRADNNEDMRMKGRASGNRNKGVHHPKCITTTRDEMVIKRLSCTGKSMRAVALKTGFSRSVIKRVLEGRI